MVGSKTKSLCAWAAQTGGMASGMITNAVTVTELDQTSVPVVSHSSIRNG